MSVPGTEIVAKAGGSPIRRVGAYVKAHWKELLALTFAAIPALFIVFHAGARKSAQSILTLPPLGAAAPGGAAAGTSISTPPVVTSPVADRSVNPSPPPAQPWSRAGGLPPGLPVFGSPAPVSVNGFNARDITAPDTKGSSWTGTLVKRVPVNPS